MQCWENEKVLFALNLGDTIDFRGIKTEASKHLKEIVRKLTSSAFKTYHIFGNHEMILMDRTEIIQTLNIPEKIDQDLDKCAYYSVTFEKHDLKLIVLDTYEISFVGRAKNHKNTELATKMTRDLQKKYPNDAHYQNWNGAIGVNQIKW